MAGAGIAILHAEAFVTGHVSPTRSAAFLGSSTPAPPCHLMDAAAAAGRGRRRLLRPWGADDVGLGPLAVAVSASACITALTAPVRAPAAVLAGVVTLFVGVWVSTVGRGRRRRIGFVNLCFSFLVLVVAVAQGGDFDPDLLLKIYNAL